ncbi:hypothetical protein [Streptomyces sp. ISL-94]|uniref:hypothetical protein n=1 Tax=Streptomyces sp. ISL-94 TaxID=2819190 RepID=UPI001BE72A06|nr:hypothetical protein [Streptomyces sp. ISL-94]MBT2481504.1 hypothetical protein [Streptomyces sp. ISL-94]
MYEMRAESTDDPCELIWHVVAKDTIAGTLCGGRLAPHATAAEPAVTAATERYCDPCMTAFGTALQAWADPSSRKEPA